MGGALKQIDQSSMHSLHSLSFSKHSNESPDKPAKSLLEQGEPLDQNMDELRDLLHSKVDRYLVEDLNVEEEKERSVSAKVGFGLVSGTPSQRRMMDQNASTHRGGADVSELHQPADLQTRRSHGTMAAADST